MKLVRYGPVGAEKPGLVDAEGHLRDLSQHVSDIDPSVLAPDRLAALAALATDSLPKVDGSPRLGPPIIGTTNVPAIGLNYADHAAETGATPPTEPIIFNKAPSCISGPNDPIILPKNSVNTDYESELAVIIGSRAQYVEEADAFDYVAGYAVMNDVSEREYQNKGTGQWTKGKSFESFGPLGPWLVTRDEVADPQALNIWLEVNGERRQDSSTSNMIFSVAHLVSYASRFFTLLPGDIITTGTPPGVGAGMTPPTFMKPGDSVRLGVEGLGAQDHEVRAWGD